LSSGWKDAPLLKESCVEWASQGPQENLFTSVLSSSHVCPLCHVGWHIQSFQRLGHEHLWGPLFCPP
jgi:hypothetical protein